MRTYFGFLLSPILPCMLLARLFMARMNLPGLIFVTFCELVVCYAIVAVIAIPVFFWLPHRGKVGLLHCVTSGFGIGILVTLPVEIISNGLHAMYDMGNYAPGLITIGMGIFGASIGFLFWLIALSPLCSKCKAAHG